MGVRLVGGGGNVQNAAIVGMLASGVVRANGLVVFGDTANLVSGPPVSGTGISASTTNLIGVSLDYVQGASDTLIRVIPFAPGQLWEVDCANSAATSNLFLRHQFADITTLRNITSISETASTGCFLAIAMSSGTTGSGKLIGTFLQRPSVLGKDGVASTT